MAALLKASEFLKLRGWSPENPEAHPNATEWKKGTTVKKFIDAYLHEKKASEK